MTTSPLDIKFEDALPKLMQVELFCDFATENEENASILKRVFEKFSLRFYDRGETIITEGEKGTEFYILLEGHLQVLRKTPCNDQIAIADLDDTQHIFFGESSLLGTDIRTATVMAKSRCRVLVMNGSDFLELCKENPLLGFYAYKRIAERMQSSVKRANKDITVLYDALFREVESNA